MNYAHRREKLKKRVINDVLIALNYIDDAHKALTDALRYQYKNTHIERNDLYDYGLSDVNFHKVKLANIKKTIISITGNSRYRDLKELEHAESLA